MEMNLLVGDLEPAVEVTILSGKKRLPVDLSGNSVTFTMRSVSHEIKVDAAAAEVYDAENGKVRYNWAEGDTNTAGIFIGEFHVVDRFHIPNIKITIRNALQ